MIKLFDHNQEHFLKVQPFKSHGVFIKRKGDRFFVVGKTNGFKNRLEDAGFKFSDKHRAWLFPARYKSTRVYDVLGDALGIHIDLSKYHHILGKLKMKIVQGMRPDDGLRRNYELQLIEFIGKIKAKILPEISAVLLKYKSDYKHPECLKELLHVLKSAKERYNYEAYAHKIAENVVSEGNRVNKARFATRIGEVYGNTHEGFL